jgi:hypothetical protein
MKVIIKTDTGLTFEHKRADSITVMTGLHVIEGNRERVYNYARVLWVETESGEAPRHKTVKEPTR